MQNQLESLESQFEQECLSLDQSNPATHSLDFTEIFTKTPEFYRCFFRQAKLSLDDLYLTKTGFFQSSKFKIYKYFWSSGFYLTSGAKFGGDYLVYPGDPNRFHSKFILVCTDDDNKTPLGIRELITYARMATGVKKTFVLASCCARTVTSDECLYEKYNLKIRLDDQTDLSLTSINWAHM